jgi:enoyl-[acyl-carrier protein] reductase I
VRTLAGAGIAEARFTFHYQTRHAPLRRPVTLEEIGGSALYMLSDLSGGVTGEIHYVDSGYHILKMPRPDDLKADAVEMAAGKDD